MTHSKILVIGATGSIGKFVALASASLHHPTFVLVRPETLHSKADLISSFKDAGITVLQGSLDDHDSLVAAIKQVDVVISTVGIGGAGAGVTKQMNIIAAIKEVGTIKRFFPSDFGGDFDRVQPPPEPAKSFFKEKVQMRRVVEESQIPHTFVVSNGLAGSFLDNLFQSGRTTPPTDKVTIYGSGDMKTICVLEDDFGIYTVKAVDDPRTINKKLHLRPPANILTQNELVSLWEKKIGKTLEKEFISEEAFVKQVEDTPFPGNVLSSIIYNIAFQEGLSDFALGPEDVEASTLYPDVKYTTVDEYLNRFV